MHPFKGFTNFRKAFLTFIFLDVRQDYHWILSLITALIPTWFTLPFYQSDEIKETFAMQQSWILNNFQSCSLESVVKQFLLFPEETYYKCRSCLNVNKQNLILQTKPKPSSYFMASANCKSEQSLPSSTIMKCYTFIYCLLIAR